jgi:3-deoxy-7-phosphoheptulonate synthase
MPHHPARRPQDGELHAECVAETAAKMEKAGVAPRIMIDCSHANSNKDYRRQAIVCHDVAGRLPRATSASWA